MAYAGSDGYTTDASGTLDNQNNAVAGLMNNLPQYQTTLNNQAGEAARQGYNNATGNVKKSANSRGLLYSGLEQGGEAAAGTQAAGAAANQVVQNNMGLSNMANGANNALMQNGMAAWQGQNQSNTGAYGNAVSGYSSQEGQIGSGIGGALSLGGLALSDKNAKKNIKDGKGATVDLLESVSPKTYDYKDKNNGAGKHVGFLAQDLEKSKVGKSLVKDTPQGKQVDMAKGLASILSAQSMIHDRLKKVEGKAG